MIRVLTIFGTRPEAIKLAPILHELARRPEEFRSRVCVTAQHRQMLDQMLQLFRIVPDYDLDIMRHEQTLTQVTVAVLDGLNRVLEAEQPDWVIVQGDTTTTMAGGLGAFHHGCRIAHVEAGLRTLDRHDPWPEEMNRRVAGVVADVHFAPTEVSAGNLYREGIPPENVFVTGNTVIDAFKTVASLPFDPRGTALGEVALGDKRLIVVTAHRREKQPAEIEEICRALVTIAERHEDVQIICPVHLRSGSRDPFHRLLGDVPRIALLPPLDYQEMVWLLQRCHFVITDSGGLQEEAAEVGKPVLVIRNATERAEGAAAEIVRIVGSDRREIEAWASRLLDEPETYARMARATNPYGDGDAARRIVDILSRHSRALPGDLTTEVSASSPSCTPEPT